MKKTKKSSFYPIGSLTGKKNYKYFCRIKKDGTRLERILLDIEDQRERERIICLHYLKHNNHMFRDEWLGVNIISRDDPWDFKLEYSTGQIFNLEITSIADGVDHFTYNKNEERFMKGVRSNEISFHELIKLNKFFPDQKTTDFIENEKLKKTPKDTILKNPITLGSRIFICMREPDNTLENIIRISIEKKVEKKHPDKENTILIIDNRTSSFEIKDFQTVLTKLSQIVETYPFREIWLYNGYFSDNDGNNAEYSFVGLKLTKNQIQIMSKIDPSRIDANGVYTI